VRDPTIADVGADAAVQGRTDGGQFHFEFAFDPSVSDSVLTYETSIDLKTWDTQTLLPSWITEEGNLRHVDATFDHEDDQQFHRLRVE